jgi:hypothetical protein
MPSIASPKPGRIRRRIGLVLLTAGLLFTGACVASAKWWVGYSTDTWLADFGDGTLYTKSLTPRSWDRPLLGWQSGPNGRYYGKSWEWTWWVFGETKASGDPIQGHSVWPVAPLFTVTGLTLFLFGRRAAKRAAGNQCLKCGYSRTGIAATAACPECGTPPLLPPSPPLPNTLTPTK